MTKYRQTIDCHTDRINPIREEAGVTLGIILENVKLNIQTLAFEKALFVGDKKRPEAWSYAQTETDGRRLGRMTVVGAPKYSEGDCRKRHHDHKRDSEGSH